MKRILITGNSGAGKSTLAKQLSGKFNLPLVHLDQHFWQPNWELPDMDIWRQEVTRMVTSDKWVIEGNFASTFDIRFPRATTIIHFDLPRPLCLYRCIKRTIVTGNKTRSDMAQGCIVRFNLDFYKYIWSYSHIHGPKVLAAVEKYSKANFVVLNSMADVRSIKKLYGV